MLGVDGVLKNGGHVSSLTVGMMLGDGGYIYLGHRLSVLVYNVFLYVDLWVKYELLTLQLESVLTQQQSSLSPSSPQSSVCCDVRMSPPQSCTIHCGFL